MIVPLILILLLCLYGMKFAGTGDKYFDDYMSRDSTLSIKGLFTLLIFISHFSQYITYSNALDNAYAFFQIRMGQTVVAMFLFYSGYGIMESVKRKGEGYVRRLPVHRVLKVLAHFDIAVLLFWLLQSVIGTDYEAKTIALSFVGWDSIGNSNWYIFDILCAYLITWLGFAVFKKKPGALICVTVLSAVFVVFMMKHKQSQWYDTFLCYAAGMWYSYFRDGIEKALQKTKLSWLISFLLFVAAFIAIRLKWTAGYRVIGSVIFAMGFMVFTMKFKMDNAVLRWFGDHLFEVYMLQRIPMIALGYLGLDRANKYIYLAVCFALAIVIAWLFKKLLAWFDGLTFERKARI